MKKTDAQKVRELRERIVCLEADLKSMDWQLRKMTRAHEVLSARYNGFVEAVQLLAPHMPSPKAPVKEEAAPCST